MLIELINIFMLLSCSFLVSLLHYRNHSAFKTIKVHDVLDMNEFGKYTFMKFELVQKAIKRSFLQFYLLNFVKFLFSFIKYLLQFDIFIMVLKCLEHVFLSVRSENLKKPTHQLLFEMFLNVFP